MSRSRTNLPQHVIELMLYIEKGDHDKFVEVFEDNSPSNMHHFLNRVLTQHDSDTTTPEIKTGQERIAEFLFQNYIDSVLTRDSSVWQEKDHDTGETIKFSSSTVAGNISYCLSRPYLKESLNNTKLQEVLKFTATEKQKIITSLSTNEYELSPDEQIQLLDYLDKQIDGILDGREATILLSEADNIFQKMLSTFETSDAAKDEICNIRDMLANTDIPVSDKIKQLQTSLTNLTKFNPEFKKEFSQFLQKIGESVGIFDDRASREETGQPIQSSTPRPDIIENENPQSLRPDLIDDEIQGTTGNPSQKTAKQIQDEEEEEARRKLAAGQNAGTNNSNHFSSSSELDQTKLAAISLKMAAILAIALGIGGPAGFILAVGFAMITNNIANGKEVSYVSSPNQTQNVESQINEDMIKQLLQSSQRQATPTYQAATEEDTQLMKKLGGEVTKIDTTLFNRRDRLKAANARQPAQRERTDEVLKQHSLQSESTRGGSDTDEGHQTSR